MPSKKIFKNCIFCQKKVLINPRAKFCNRKCFGLFFKGKKQPVEAIKKMAETRKLMFKNGYKHPMTGRHHTEEFKKKLREMNTKEKHPQWKGGKTKSRGYVYIRVDDHPFKAKSNNLIGEHRLVMEKMLGRYLTKKEVVHHLNGIKTV